MLEKFWKKNNSRPLKALEFKSSICFKFALIIECISPVLAFTVDYKQVDNGNVSPAFIITVLRSTVQYTSVSFEAPRPGYGFLLIILVLENCKFTSLKVLEFFALIMLYAYPVRYSCIILFDTSVVWHAYNFLHYFGMQCKPIFDSLLIQGSIFSRFINLIPFYCSWWSTIMSDASHSTQHYA